MNDAEGDTEAAAGTDAEPAPGATDTPTAQGDPEPPGAHGAREQDS
jgi:hypothetical protein